IESLSQLYPLLIAPVFARGYVPHDLFFAHLLNAWVMSSACIPAFLLARRVTGRFDAAVVAGVLAVCIPWIIYSSMLMTEVAAYPAFLWALLAMQRAVSAPSTRNDVVALAALALAVLPAVIAAGWLFANLVRPAAGRELHAFACIGSLTMAATLVQGTDFDARYTGYVHDRFLLYLAPVVVIGVLCAVVDQR